MAHPPPKLPGGLLANRSDAEHMEQLKKHDIEPIDLVVSNLYPFTKAVASGKGFEDCIEMIDIGGPTMVRAAAKNCDSVAVVTSPAQYDTVCFANPPSPQVLETTLSNCPRPLDRCWRRCAPTRVPWARPRAAGWPLRPLLRRPSTTQPCRPTLPSRRAPPPPRLDSGRKRDLPPLSQPPPPTPRPRPSQQTRTYTQEGKLRYGVNPHQSVASYNSLAGKGLPFEVLNGQPGYTNLMDALNAWQVRFLLSPQRLIYY